MLKIILFYLFLITVTLGEKFRFDNYSLYRVTPNTREQLISLQELRKNSEKYDFWNEPFYVSKYVSIVASPNDKGDLEKYLNANKIDFEIPLPNIQEVIDKETDQALNTRVSAGSMKWDAYYKLEEIYAWIDDLVKTYPKVASVIIGGTTYENRQIKGIKISHGTGRRVIFIESGLHAREWITPATTNYFINELLTSKDELTQAAAKEFDWHIFPVTNPDGYVWSHTQFRLWRKNRRPFGNEFGVDLNRNWDDNWGGEGSSHNVTSALYAGPSAFSEVETKTLSEYLTSLADQMDLYLSIHSAGQLLLIPFGNTTQPLANYEDAMNIGRRAMGALSVRYGTPYVTGNIAEAIYIATGTSIDWVKERLKIPLVYCYELRDRGTYGHLLPADQILASGQETWDSVLELIHQAKRFGYMNSAASGVQATVFTVVFVAVNYLVQW